MVVSLPALIKAEPTKTVTVSVVGQIPLSTVTIYVVVEEGKANGLATVVLLNPAAGVQVKVEPPGPVGLPPNCTLSPKQMVVSFPALAKGAAKIVTFVSIIVEGQPHPLRALTVTVPVPEFPQVTLMELDPCPELITPPLTVQLNVKPGIVGVV